MYGSEDWIRFPTLLENWSRRMLSVLTELSMVLMSILTLYIYLLLKMHADVCIPAEGSNVWKISLNIHMSFT